MKKLPNLDILRLFLACAVVLFHIPVTMDSLGFNVSVPLAIFKKGDEAVSFFFTLSGFLILRLLFIEKTEQGNINIRDFYIRRVLRISPLYYLILLAGFVLYHVLLPVAGLGKPPDYSTGSMLAHFTLLAPNVFIFSHKVGPILHVLWSIGVEEQFYLFAPLFIFLIPKNRLVAGLGMLLAISLVLCLGSEFLYRNRMNYYYFVFGGLISILSYRYDLRKVFNNPLFRWTVVGLFFLYFFTELIPLKDETKRVFAMMLSGLYITKIADYPQLIISNKRLNYFGRISYGIYMYHFVVLTFLMGFFRYVIDLRAHSGPLLVALFTVAALAATVFVSHLSYRYFESRFIRLKAAYRPDTPPAAAVPVPATPSGKELV